MSDYPCVQTGGVPGQTWWTLGQRPSPRLPLIYPVQTSTSWEPFKLRHPYPNYQKGSEAVPGMRTLARPVSLSSLTLLEHGMALSG